MSTGGHLKGHPPFGLASAAPAHGQDFLGRALHVDARAAIHAVEGGRETVLRLEGNVVHPGMRRKHGLLSPSHFVGHGQ